MRYMVFSLSPLSSEVDVELKDAAVVLDTNIRYTRNRFTLRLIRATLAKTFLHSKKLLTERLFNVRNSVRGSKRTINWMCWPGIWLKLG